MGRAGGAEDEDGIGETDGIGDIGERVAPVALGMTMGLGGPLALGFLVGLFPRPTA